MSQRSVFAVAVAALALVVGLVPATNGGARSAAGVSIVSVTPTTRTTNLSTTKVNTVAVRRDLRYKVVIRNADRVRRQVRVTMAVAQPQPADSATAVRAFRAQETKAVTLKTVGPLALGQRLNLTVTVRAGNGAALRRSYPVIFTLRD
jgi:hypothetical protein